MAYNDKSRENLIPFKKGKDPRRQVGRKKGSLNQRTVIKNLLNEDISPDMIFSSTTKKRLKGMGGRTYLEALTITLINQGLDGNPQASNILLRELRKVEEAEPKETAFDRMGGEIQITVVNSMEEIERLKSLTDNLESKYGNDYENLSENIVSDSNNFS